MLYYYFRWTYGMRQWLLRSLTPMGVGVLSILLVAAVLGLGTPQSLCHLIFVFAVVLLGLAAVGSRWMRYQFRAMRFLPRFGTVGEPLEYRVIVQNTTPRAQMGLTLVESLSQPYPSYRAYVAWLRECSLTMPPMTRSWPRYVAKQNGAIAQPHPLPHLAAQAKTKAKLTLVPLRRGRLTLNTLTLACPDPLGLVYTYRAHHQPQSLCILPQRYRIPPLKLPSSRRHQSGEVALATAAGESMEFRSLRDYRPGDPINKIHWKSWAKTGRPIVKEQQDESAVHYALIVDTFAADTPDHTVEAVIAIAISFLFQEQPEESLLDVIFATPDPRCVSVGRGLPQREPVLETLATLPPHPAQSIDILTPILKTRLSRLSCGICILRASDPTRHQFLTLLDQHGLATIVLLVQEHPRVQAPPFPPLSPLCKIHPISVHQIQQDLLRL